MKINSLRISNILSFGYHANIANAQLLSLNAGLNILIGQNGSGKSTVLEVINLICRRVLFRYIQINENNFDPLQEIPPEQLRQTVSMEGRNNADNLRLDAHWDHPSNSQSIQVEISLDAIDAGNMALLHQHRIALGEVALQYSAYSGFLSDVDFTAYPPSILLDVELQKEGPAQRTFSITPHPADAAFRYLERYNFYQYLIKIHNRLHPDQPIPELADTFTMITSFRNYSGFNTQVNLRDSQAAAQLQSFRNAMALQSLNSIEGAEPMIFSLVKLNVAQKHFDIYGNGITRQQAEDQANAQTFLVNINTKLALIGLEAKITLLDQRTWTYDFKLRDIRRNVTLTDINSLSSGQKAIMHLIFEAYGRGALKGGVIVIDEPEIHLHHQFQHEYLRIIQTLQKEQGTQYIVVTHSESLIHAETIKYIKRFSLDIHGLTVLYAPVLTEPQKTLIKILDNTRSTYAFFASKVILVEGQTDRYLLQAIIEHRHPSMSQAIAVLDMGGKNNYGDWRTLFTNFGLQVFYVGDFDNVFDLALPGTSAPLIPKPTQQASRQLIQQRKLTAVAAHPPNSLSVHFTNLTAAADFLTNPQLAPWSRINDHYKQLIKVSNAEMVAEIRTTHPSIETDIEALYPDRVFILKRGAIEEYTGTDHGRLDQIINLCNLGMTAWLAGADSSELKFILDQIVA